MLILIFLNSLLVSFVRKSASWIIRGLTGVTSRSTLRANALPKIRCLGFAPRSGSFAFEPAVLVSSIPSLSGIPSLSFTHSVRKSASSICFVLTEFRLSGSAPVGSICSLSGISSLSFIHSVRKSA